MVLVYDSIIYIKHVKQMYTIKGNIKYIWYIFICIMQILRDPFMQTLKILEKTSAFGIAQVRAIASAMQHIAAYILFHHIFFYICNLHAISS